MLLVSIPLTAVQIMVKVEDFAGAIRQLDAITTLIQQNTGKLDMLIHSGGHNRYLARHQADYAECYSRLGLSKEADTHRTELAAIKEEEWKEELSERNTSLMVPFWLSHFLLDKDGKSRLPGYHHETEARLEEFLPSLRKQVEKYAETTGVDIDAQRIVPILSTPLAEEKANSGEESNPEKIKLDPLLRNLFHKA